MVKDWCAPTFIAHVVMISVILAACGGKPSGGNWSPSGSLPASFTMSAVPSSVPGGISILSFELNVSDISLTSATTGKSFNFTVANPTLDLNKQLSDSAYLGTGTFPADTYNQVDLTITGSRLVYCTSATGVPGCAPGTIQTVTGSPAVLPFNFSQPTLGPSTTGIGVRFRMFMANALVLNSSGTAVQSIGLTRPQVALAEQLPLAANLTSGQLDYIEDLTGVVKNVTASTITLQTALAGTITANVAGTSAFAIPPCTNNAISCVQVGQVADIDTVLNADGTFTLMLFDPIDSTSNDWVEGVIGYAPTSTFQFQLVVTNFVPATTSSKIGTSLHIGDQTTVSISAGVSFDIDGKNLFVPANRFAGAQTTSELFPGQVVAARASSFTAASGATPALLTADALTLRFSRLSGMPASSGLNFQFVPIGPYFGLQNGVPSYETSGVTNYDLANPGSTISVNTPAAIRALYFSPNLGFTIAKVRQ